MNEKLGDLQRLKHIAKCISDLNEILEGIDEDGFYRDTEKKYAVERIFEIIGEAINNISNETLSKSGKPVPWREVVDFRNVVSHEYFRVDYTMVYRIATEEVKELKLAVDELIELLDE